MSPYPPKIVKTNIHTGYTNNKNQILTFYNYYYPELLIVVLGIPLTEPLTF